jgi:hypothetical protein
MIFLREALKIKAQLTVLSDGFYAMHVFNLLGKKTL